MRGSPSSGAPPRLTPDERWLVWADGFNLRVRPVSGGDWRLLVTVQKAATTNTFATEFAPTADSKSVLYHDVDHTGKHGLFRVPIAGGAPERLGDYAGPAAWFGNLEVSPDGRRILAESVSPEQQTELWLLRNFAPASAKR